MSTSIGPSERSVPAQARSRERRERILDAAARVFSEVGFEAATTEAIAEAAETSIGSVYRFYPNKKALFAALHARYMEKLRSLLDFVVEDREDQPWEDVIGAMVDGVVAFHEADPGFRAIWLSLRLTDQMIVEGEELNKEFVSRLVPLLARRFPRLSPDDRPVVATVAVEAVGAMLIVAARRGPPLGPAVLREAKALVVRYLAPFAGPPSAALAAPTVTEKNEKKPRPKAPRRPRGSGKL